MAYKVIILYQLYMPSYFLGTFTEYPLLISDGEDCTTPIYRPLFLLLKGRSHLFIRFSRNGRSFCIALQAEFDRKRIEHIYSHASLFAGNPIG